MLASWITIRTFFAPGLLELLAGALAGDVLGLADVNLVGRQRVEGAEPRVDGDDLDALRRRLRERILERARVRHRRRDHLRARAMAALMPGTCFATSLFA